MATTYRGYPGSASVPPMSAEGNEPIPLVSPPPPPSRRANAYGPSAMDYGAPPAPVAASAVDQFAETTPRDDENPFQKPPSRFRRWLKRPSREVVRTAGVAVLAAGLGWLGGAKPWKAKPVAHAAVAMKAPRAVAARSPAPRRVAVMTHSAVPALKPTLVTAKPSQPSHAVTSKATTAKTSANTSTHQVTTSKATASKATTSKASTQATSKAK